MEPPIVGAQEVKKDLSQPKVMIIDVREKKDYDKGHVPGAVFAEIKDIEELKPRLEEAEKIYVYSNDYDCPASTIASKEIMKMGFNNVYDFKGSYKEWVDKGYQIESSIE
ncbi:MAG: rhodanese-like domain-containing protein [Archaeoglobaceae archaeon]